MFYETVTKHHFIDTFKQSAERKDQFSYEALEQLFQYYDDLSEDTGKPIEFDMIGICGEWSALNDNTTVLRVPGFKYLVLEF